MINLTALAVTLPVLILITAAAVDVIRLPIVKQTMHSTLHAGYDMLILNTKDNRDWEDLASGQNWCLFSTPNNPNFRCPSCNSFQIGKSCTGAADFDAAEGAINNAGRYILSELTRPRNGIFSHNLEDVAVSIAIYNLLVSRNSTRGRIVGKELVARYSSPSEASGLRTSINLERLIENTFIKPKNRYLGFYLGEFPNTNAKAANVPLVVLNVDIRVSHFFRITRKLQLDMGVEDSELETDGTILRATILRPLTRAVRLSGARKRSTFAQ